MKILEKRDRTNISLKQRPVRPSEVNTPEKIEEINDIVIKTIGDLRCVKLLRLYASQLDKFTT